MALEDRAYGIIRNTTKRISKYEVDFLTRKQDQERNLIKILKEVILKKIDR